MTSLLLLVLLSVVLAESPPEVLECSCPADGELDLHTTVYNAGTPEWTAEIKIVKSKCIEPSYDEECTDDSDTITYPVVQPTGPSTAIGEQKSPKLELWRTLPLASGYETFDGLNSSYKFNNVSATWENARRQCEKEGAHLAIINSENESNALKKLYSRYNNLKDVQDKNYAYIGFHDMYDEGNYVTIFGEPISATGFNRTKNDKTPTFDNSGQDNGNPGQDCGCFLKESGGLSVYFCDYNLASICERETDYYPPRSREIDYSAGAYDGVEMEVKPPNGTVLRTRPSLGYEYFPGVGFYRFHTYGTTWENARRICKAEGGHLAIINSQSEHQVLMEIYGRTNHFENVDWTIFAFIGFHDQYTEGNYVTIYDEPLNTTGFYTWNGNEPTNSGGSGTQSGEDCGGIAKAGGYNDLPCNKKNAFFCEQELYM